MKRKVLVRGIVSVMAAVLLASCGGGGGSGGGDNNPPPATQPPSGLQYPAHSAYVIQQAVTPLTPTVTGQVTSYSISPSLPTGLAFSATTGVISGTPTVIAASATYTVTATNDGGSTTTTVSIAVNDITPTAAYASSYYAFTANIATQAIKPTVGGGAITSWSVNPALPAGLTLSSTDGTISGIPTAGSAPTVYTVTAANSGGPVTASLTLAVAAAPLIDLGHSSEVLVLVANASRLLSLDSNGHWILQNYATGATIAQGDYPCRDNCRVQDEFRPIYPIDIQGSVMLDSVANGPDFTTDSAELRSTDDGHLLGTIGTGGYSWRQLATDGSYLTAGNSTVLKVWSSSGQVLVSRNGDYSAATAFAGPGQVLVARGGAGQNVVETISVPTGTSSVSAPFQGQFAAWFPDGARFLTTQGTAVWTYSSAAVQQDVGQLANAAPTLLVNGSGNYVWTFDYSTGVLSVYPLGATSAAPVFTGTFAGKPYAVASGNTLVAFTSGSSQITAIDLSGGTPTSTNISLPLVGANTYAALQGGAWAVGTNQGVIVDGASLSMAHPRFLALGHVSSIAGGSQFFSVATAAGSIFTYDTSNNTLVNTINFPAAALAASSSGAVVAAFKDPLYPTQTLNVYSLPNGTITGSYPVLQSVVLPFALSAAGDVVVAPLVNTSGCKNEAFNVVSSALLWCLPEGVGTLSPDGTLAAGPTVPPGVPQLATSIYRNGTLSGTLPGTVAEQAIGWVDNNRLVASTYGRVEDDEHRYLFATIYDSQGHELSRYKPPETLAFDVVTSDTIYSRSGNAIYSLTTGSTLWTSGNTIAEYPGGAASGPQIVFVSGALVLAQPH